MARTETPAQERTRQNRALVEQVSAELGRRVGVREAVMYRRGQREGLPEVSYLVKDKIPDFADANRQLVGQVLCKVIDYKIVRGGLALLSLQTSAVDYAHILADAALLSQSHSLLATLEAVSRKGNGDADVG